MNEIFKIMKNMKHSREYQKCEKKVIFVVENFHNILKIIHTLLQIPGNHVDSFQEKLSFQDSRPGPGFQRNLHQRVKTIIRCRCSEVSR